MALKRASWWLALLATMFVTDSTMAASIDEAKLKAVEQAFAQNYMAHPLGSMTIGVVSGTDLIWTKSYGYADIEARKPATPNTVYRIGSITKQFTAVMLLQLADRGKVSLSDPVVKYYPEIEKLEGWPSERPITLLDLATHRGGLAREPDDCKDTARTNCPYHIGPVASWEHTLDEAVPHIRIEWPPETTVRYSNVGYAILGAALSQAAQTPYTAYVAQNIFAPLGMTHTAFEPGTRMLANLAKGYSGLPGAYSSSKATFELKNGRGYKVPNGAIFTTVGDLAKFVSFEMGDGPQNVLKPQALHANYERSFPWDEQPGESYGVGFQKKVVNGHIIIGHGGEVAGYSAYAIFEPDQHIGIICLRNSEDGSYRGVATNALASMLVN